MRKNRPSQSGQVALAILLVMGVVLTISLAVANRTTRDIAQTIQTTSASRVFSQAESATENKLNELITALQEGDIPVEDLNPSSQPGDRVTTATSFEHIRNFSQTLAVGEVAQIVLEDSVGSYAGNSLSISWSEGDLANNKASLIISEYFREDTTGEIRSRYQFVRPSCADEPDDGFQIVSCAASAEPVTYNYILVSGTLTPLFVRIQPVYHPTLLEVVGDAEDLPAQQFKITTKAVNTEEDIQQNSVIEVTTSHLLPPPFLDYALYSGGNLVK